MQMQVLDKRDILEHEVTIYGDLENPLFLAKDIAVWIEYEISNVSKMVKNVDDEEKIIARTNNTSAIFLTEDGLYEVLMLSRKPIAKQFKKQVKNMLKQIRLTGGYIPTNDEDEDDETAILAKAIMIAQKTIEKKDELLKSKTRELEDKNKFINQIASSQNTLLVREVAKVISSNSGIVIGEKKLYQKLRDWGLIFKNKNEPQQKYIKQGLLELTEGVRNTSTGTFTYQTMRVTGKGQEYILKRLLREQQVYSQWA